MIQVVLKTLAFFHFGLMVSTEQSSRTILFGDRAATALQMRAFGAPSQPPPSVSASLLSSGPLLPAANRRKVSSVGREKERRKWQARVHSAGAHQQPRWETRETSGALAASRISLLGVINPPATHIFLVLAFC
jgi:hypothetical protein